MHNLSMSPMLADSRPGWLGAILGRLLGLIYRLTGRDRYDNFRLERLGDLKILVMPTVSNPKVLRTGAFFASQLDGRVIGPSDEVLDLGTGSGVCALFAAQLGGRVVATDINPAAVRCALVNALMNGLEKNIEFRQGDLFTPVGDERFDVVLFNPPFLLGAPKDDRDAAWHSQDVAERFATGLANHLKSDGVALLLLSSFGDACAVFESELRSRGLRLEVFARRRYVNEVVTILRATRGEAV